MQFSTLEQMYNCYTEVKSIKTLVLVFTVQICRLIRKDIRKWHYFSKRNNIETIRYSVLNLFFKIIKKRSEQHLICLK